MMMIKTRKDVTKTKMMIGMIILVLATGIILGSTSPLLCKQDKGMEVTQQAPVTTSKVVGGKIGVIKPGYITVIYKVEENEDGSKRDYEVLLPIDDSILIVHKKNLSELQEGDTVEIIYNETNWVDKKGNDRLERKAMQIKFIRSKTTGLRSGM